MTAPARRSRPTTSASEDGIRFSKSWLAAVVRTPAVSIRSFSATGIPCSGPRQLPREISSSAMRASARAESPTVMKALSVGLSRSMRSRQARVNSTGEISRRRKRGARCAIVSRLRIVVEAFIVPATTGAILACSARVGANDLVMESNPPLRPIIEKSFSSGGTKWRN